MSLSGRITRPRALVVLVTGVLLLAGCSSSPGAGRAARTDTAESSAARVAAAAAPYVRVVAAGDIACAPGGRVTATTCRQASTASWAARLNPRFVFTLGDTQYEKSSLAELRGSYDKSWGRLLSRTRPTIGNHEYKTPGAAGYYAYFKDRQPGAPGYYRAATKGWQFYYLNSNCDQVDCAAQAQWLDEQMTANPSRCTIVTMHHPRFSSGLEHGNNTAVKPLWDVAYAHGNDIVLSGHDHDYERFVPMDGAGRATSRGMQEFVVGTGGRNLYHLGTRKAGSAYFQARIHGVLALDLREGSYHWVFRAIDGRILDRGDRSCV